MIVFCISRAGGLLVGVAGWLAGDCPLVESAGGTPALGQGSRDD